MDDSQINRIIERAVRTAVEAQGTDYQLLEQRLEALVKLVEKHDGTLYGNGREGLTSIVDRIERIVTTAQDVLVKVMTTLTIAGAMGLIVLLVERGFLKP